MFLIVTSEGCTYCKQFEPVVEKIAANYKSPVYYYERDDELEDMGFNVEGTPTTYIIIDGIIAKEIIGYRSYEDIAKIINQFVIE